MVDVMVPFLKALSMMGKQYYIFNTILEFSTEFQIWNSWECFQVQRMRCGQCCLLSSIFWRRSILWKKGKGKPRVLQCDGARGVNCTGPNYIPEENMTFVRW